MCITFVKTVKLFRCTDLPEGGRIGCYSSSLTQTTSYPVPELHGNLLFSSIFSSPSPPLISAGNLVPSILLEVLSNLKSSPPPPQPPPHTSMPNLSAHHGL